MNNITLTNNQQAVLDQLIKFVESPNERIFILKGYAGTGKTTLMRFLIGELNKRKQYYMLLATTGRAAKVLSNISDNPARTIHSLIYSFKDLNQDLSDVPSNVEPSGQLYLVFEPSVINTKTTPPTIYIIDEASMLSDIEEKDITQAKFGSGRLLTDLFNYDSRPDSKYIFVGDPCQLPPVFGDISPALETGYIRHTFGIEAKEVQLTRIVRQQDGNSLIPASQEVRKLWANAPDSTIGYGSSKVWGLLPFRHSNNITLHANNAEMGEDYYQKIKDGDYMAATYLCRSNRECARMSANIRSRLGFNPSHPQKGDLLMVIQNNSISGLMNGDMVRVEDVDNFSNIVAKLSFRRITVTELFSGQKYSQLLIDDIVNQNQPNLNQSQQKGLFIDFARRMKAKGIRQGSSEFTHAMQYDPYLNALRCTYGYAITCHKAQGGEWRDVYVEVLRNITLNPTKHTYQWIYTAMTRASKTLHLVSDFFIR